MSTQPAEDTEYTEVQVTIRRPGQATRTMTFHRVRDARLDLEKKETDPRGQQRIEQTTSVPLMLYAYRFGVTGLALQRADGTIYESIVEADPSDAGSAMFGEDQPDPRVMLAAEAIASRYGDSPRQYLGDAQRVVDALDAADRAAGIRRVTKEQIDWCARRLSNAADMLGHIKWDTAEDVAINERLMATLRAGSQGIRGLRGFPSAAGGGS